MQKLTTFKFAAAAVLLIGGTIMFSGCSTRFPRLTEPNAEYETVLKEPQGHVFTDPAGEQAALDRVIQLFEDFSAENLKVNTRKVYAEKLYFRDGFRLVRDLDSLDAYFQHSAGPLEACTFEFAEPIRHNGDFYLRWTMMVRLKRSPETVDRVIGMSHIRFNEGGRVIFQQDYWDPTDVLYRKIPIANRLIGYVRNKL